MSPACLVGKNESGKTAFLEALYKLNPLPGPKDKFDALRDYPRVRLSEDEASVGERTPIVATFELEDDDLAAIEAKFGKGCVKRKEFEASRNYENDLKFAFDINELKIIKHLLSSKSIDAEPFSACKTIDELKEALAAAEQPPEGIAALKKELGNRDIWEEIADAIEERMPKFLLFSNYSTLPGIFSIPYIQGRNRDQLDFNETTAKALLQLAGVGSSKFTEAEYEPRQASLEAAMSRISAQAFKYWKQNKDLRMKLDVDFKMQNIDKERIGPFLQVRVDNLRHWVSLNLTERSTGFIWFISFFTYFSAFRSESRRMITLLDEPGLGLHAAGQGDLLDMIDQELAPKHQVIYTAHSPFMIRPNQLQRSRTVEDIDERGTVISEEVFGNKKETIFPLQAALGYTMAQTLFVGADNLVVEGPSDMIYLQLLSDVLESKNRVGLSTRWTLVPAGGVDKVPAFIALYGVQLNVAVLLDSPVGSHQRVQSMIDRGLLHPNKLVNIAEFTGRKSSDIEDLFEEDFYVKLVADSGEATLDKKKLVAGHRIVRRIEDQLGRELNHLRPASYLLRHQATLIAKIDDATLERFEELFKRLQPLLS